MYLFIVFIHALHVLSTGSVQLYPWAMQIHSISCLIAVGKQVKCMLFCSMYHNHATIVFSPVKIISILTSLVWRVREDMMPHLYFPPTDQWSQLGLEMSITWLCIVKSDTLPTALTKSHQHYRPSLVSTALMTLTGKVWHLVKMHCQYRCITLEITVTL